MATAIIKNFVTGQIFPTIFLAQLTLTLPVSAVWALGKVEDCNGSAADFIGYFSIGFVCLQAWPITFPMLGLRTAWKSCSFHHQKKEN